MTRPILTAAVIAAVACPMFQVTDAAACHNARRVNYRTSYTSYARPVTHVVRPVTVVRHFSAPPVQVALPPIAPEPQFPVVPAGATLTLPANFLGEQSGSVFMVFQEIKLPVQVTRWSTNGVTITLPPMAIKEAVLIRLDIVLPDGRLGHSLKLHVTAPAPVVLHPVAPTSPLPTQAALQAQYAPPFGDAPQLGGQPN